MGCETVKGLVLPGIGGFTVADGSTVKEEDLGNKSVVFPITLEHISPLNVVPVRLDL